ncbi:MAG: hypothetical protein WAV76_03560 [Bacteroidota bacterium]
MTDQKNIKHGTSFLFTAAAFVVIIWGIYQAQSFLVLFPVLWGFIAFLFNYIPSLGLIGMVLCVPFTMTLKFAFENNKETRCIAVLLGPEAPSESMQIVRNKKEA